MRRPTTVAAATGLGLALLLGTTGIAAAQGDDLDNVLGLPDPALTYNGPRVTLEWCTSSGRTIIRQANTGTPEYCYDPNTGDRVPFGDPTYRFSREPRPAAADFSSPN